MCHSMRRKTASLISLRRSSHKIKHTSPHKLRSNLRAMNTSGSRFGTSWAVAMSRQATCSTSSRSRRRWRCLLRSRLSPALTCCRRLSSFDVPGCCTMCTMSTLGATRSWPSFPTCSFSSSVSPLSLSQWPMASSKKRLTRISSGSSSSPWPWSPPLSRDSRRLSIPTGSGCSSVADSFGLSRRSGSCACACRCTRPPRR
mmetsp:Transcript_103235/g.210598  ORF Transcript_103235/g.210598 Transcript_103235/m.210598 type:complete len:200 (-) Transcript_103235:977-1576(-)